MTTFDPWRTARDHARLLGASIRDRRRTLAVTLAELSNETGVSIPDLSRIQTGRMIPDPADAARLAAWVNVDRTPPHGIPRPDHARWSDPSSSEATVRSIAADETIADRILSVVAVAGDRSVDDQDIVDAIRERFGVTHQRNVIARARGILERDGMVWRIGQISRPDRTVATLHFVATTPPDADDGPEPWNRSTAATLLAETGNYRKVDP